MHKLTVPSCLIIVIATTVAPERSLAQANSDFASFVASRALVRTVPDSESVAVAGASSFLKVGRELGLGTCVGYGNESARLYALQFLGQPVQACGQTRFGVLCQQAFDNCVATESAIICDQDYLERLDMLARLVLSTDAAKPVPADGLARIARLAHAAHTEPSKAAGRYLTSNPEIRDFIAKYGWKNAGYAANLDWNMATAALGGGVVFHEFAHVEQKACALTHDDARLFELRGLLEELGCRTLGKNETRADMRALDVGAAVSNSFESFHKDTGAARGLYVRALMSRLEYEAMVLTDPAGAAQMYLMEPRERQALWTYYFTAGSKRVGTGGDDIPPELRPVATLWVLNARGFLRSKEQSLALVLGERLHPFLTGALWRACEGKRPPEAIRDALDFMMFRRDPLRTQSKPAPVEPILSRSFDFGRELAVLLGALTKDNKDLIGTAYKRAAAAALQVEFDLPVPPLSGSSAEGLMFIISTVPSIETALRDQFDKRTAAAFSFPFSVIAANMFSVDADLREPFLTRAAAAASFLGLDQAIVAQIFSYAEKGELQKLLAALDVMQRKLR
jgi:hypothetical protein